VVIIVQEQPILWPLHRSTCVSKHPNYALKNFVEAKFYCPYVLTDGNWCIEIREKMLEFSSAVLPKSSSYHKTAVIII